MNSTLLVVSIVAAGIALAGVITFGVLALIRFLANRPGGFGSLAAAYPLTGAEPEPTLTRQTSKIGPVTYKNIVKMSIGREALHIRVWGKAAKIPWSEIRGVGETTFRWQKWPVLHIGEPWVADVVISPEAFRAMKDRIRATG